MKELNLFYFFLLKIINVIKLIIPNINIINIPLNLVSDLNSKNTSFESVTIYKLLLSFTKYPFFM